MKSYSPPELVFVTKPDAGLEVSSYTFAASAGVDTNALAQLLATEGARTRPLFVQPPSATIARLLAAGTPSPRSTFFQVDAPPDRLPQIRRRLSSLPYVESAYIKPPASAPVWKRSLVRTAVAPDITPNYIANQLYLDPAPTGMDARFAWALPGGKGAGVSVIDLEWGWLFQHEDLGGKLGVVYGVNDADTDHGTAVIGILGGDDNQFGVTGFVPEADLSAAAFGDDWNTSSSRAIDAASLRCRPGDIIVLEIHRPGPRTGFAEDDGQRGYIATEWFPDDFAAIQRAVGRGVVVISAAGNGAENLDDDLYSLRPPDFPSTWQNPFRLGGPSSGAVLVGAGAPPLGTHGKDHGPDRSRLDFSNYGSRVDAQGWGVEVTSCGYGDLRGGLDNTHWYTDQFSGTSSATPTVAGAVACIQGILRAAGKTPLTPDEVVTALRATGTRQQDAPTRPTAQRIGNRPDIRALHQWAAAHRP